MPYDPNTGEYVDQTNQNAGRGRPATRSGAGMQLGGDFLSAFFDAYRRGRQDRNSQANAIAQQPLPAGPPASAPMASVPASMPVGPPASPASPASMSTALGIGGGTWPAVGSTWQPPQSAPSALFPPTGAGNWPATVGVQGLMSPPPLVLPYGGPPAPSSLPSSYLNTPQG